MQKLGKLFVWVGVLGFVLAVAWWYLFFEQMLGQNVNQARECFYYTSEACAAGNTIGEVGRTLGALADIPAYSPAALWAAVGVFVLGLALQFRGKA